MAFFRGPNIITDELVGLWDSFNTKSFNNTSTMYDLSGMGNHMTSINDIHTFYNSSNKTFDTDGSLIYWKCDTLHKIYNDDDLTLQVWCKPDTTADMIWVWNDGNPGPDLYPSGDILYMNSWDGTGNPFSNYTLTGHYTGEWINEWKLITIVWDYTESINKLYINDQYIGDANYKNINSNQLNLMGSADAYAWDGEASLFLLYDKILSLEEITQNYNAHKNRFI